MSKAVMYAANTNSQTLVSGGIVNFGSEVRRYGCNINISGGNVIVAGSGYYSIDTNLTIIPTTAGLFTVSIYKDGVLIPGATVSITGVADTDYAVSIPTLVRQTCCCDATITVVISGVETTVANAAILVEKL